MENKNVSSDNQNQSAEGRRRFLKKAGVGVAIASLPAKSVWATSGLNGSVVASNNASANTSTADYHLKHPDHWLGMNKPELDHKYFDCTGGYANIDWCNYKVPNDAKKHIKIRHVLGDVHSIVHDLSYVPGVVIKYKKNGYWRGLDRSNFYLIGSSLSLYNVKAVFTNSYNASRLVSDIVKDFTGHDNMNKYIASAFLNACYHNTHGIVFPICGYENGRQLAYVNPKAFAKDMHDRRSSRLKAQLETLHFNPSNYHNV
ncbi:hypothetical protein [Glaciecola sp. 1036]|uniref:hypothetical protein n=1 Tax=Alteromonadaceae TaxID=72275 RepID=UPI003D005DFE